MTYYYYLASDKEMDSLDDSIHAAKSNIENHVGPIPGFDYPVQIEVFNGIDEEWSAQKLLQYIRTL